MQVKVIIITYFIGVLAVGFFSWFKIKSPADYYIAGKKAGTVPVAGSLLATILGGSAILGTIELSQSKGWPAMWFLFSAAAGLFILAFFSGHVRKIGHYTLPEMLGLFYGKKAEIFSSVIIPVAWLGIIAAQIIAAAKILSGLGFLSYSGAAVAAGVVFIVYTLAGGQFSILKTDTLQSVLIIAGLIALFVFSIFRMEATHYSAIENFAFFNESFTLADLLVLFLTYSVTFIVGPDIYSRLFCARSERTATRSVVLVALILIPVSVLLTWLGIFSAHFERDGIIHFAAVLLPEWAFGLFIAALLSAVMSSADTTLLTSSIILSELISGDLDKAGTLKITRFLVILSGLLSIAVALFVSSIIQALLFALTVFSGAFALPVLFGIFKIRVVKNRIVAAMLTGGSIALAGKIVQVYIDETTGNILLPASYLLSCLVLLVSDFRRNSKFFN